MKVEQIKDNGEEVRLRVSASAAEMSKAFTDGLDAFVVQYQMDQLEGDSSLEKINNALGEEDGKAAVYNAVINYLVPFALEKQGTMPVSTYGIESDETPEPDKMFSFDMTVLVKPEFELSSYKPVKVEIEPKPEVNEAEIDEQISMLVRQFSAAQQGVQPDDASLQVPEVTDKWVADNMSPMGIATVAELRDRFRATSEEELENRYAQAKMAAAMDEYAKRFEGEISEKMIEVMTQELYETFLAQLSQEGITLDAFFAQQHLTEEEVRANLATQAKMQLLQGFILDAIFRHEALKLEPSDMIAAMRNIAPGREEETFEAMQKSGRSTLLKEGASRMKAAGWIMANTEFVVAE